MSEKTVNHEQEIKDGVVGIFTDMVRMIGLPPSIGAIYGLLYIEGEPLDMDELAARLAISKGSASQGLRVLRTLGAVERVMPPGARREHFIAGTQLKRIVGAFLQTRVLPQLEHGFTETKRMENLAAKVPDAARREFIRERLDRMRNWQKRGSQALGLIHRFLD